MVWSTIAIMALTLIGKKRTAITQEQVHEYSISRTVLDADVVISIPKLKVHKKVGVTLNLKGLVGINTNKNYLVHYRVGTPSEGGETSFRILCLRFATGSAAGFTRTQRPHFCARQTVWSDALTKILAPDLSNDGFSSAFIRACPPASLDVDGGRTGYGNDSAWRMTSDIARIFYFADVHAVNSVTLPNAACSALWTASSVVKGKDRWSQRLAAPVASSWVRIFLP